MARLTISAAFFLGMSAAALAQSSLGGSGSGAASTGNLGGANGSGSAPRINGTSGIGGSGGVDGSATRSGGAAINGTSGIGGTGTIGTGGTSSGSTDGGTAAGTGTGGTGSAGTGAAGTTGAGGTGAAAGTDATLPAAWTGAPGAAFFSDPAQGTLFGADRMRTNWAALSADDRSRVRENCQAITKGLSVDIPGDPAASIPGAAGPAGPEIAGTGSTATALRKVCAAVGRM